MKTSLLAASILSITLFSTGANAQESILQSILTNMVDHAVSITTNEVKANVYQTVANTAYHFELEGEATTGKVQVTDIAATSDTDVNQDDNSAE
ncbi:hypothetical protein Q4561_14055 [Alteromonas sp. 1_MG-2023]|uniref:hypothetical protein n=1 Tax=Alteromonas sp. 1_MG-2023 TaxID=3062669 RepID=UPI0026E17DAA|nr:hypothetical protein [Alteromonas sp. 1_MG-2023]MDO6568192.1 hypothetical protein [Alteromonas sp. 1_MG-2023]